MSQVQWSSRLGHVLAAAGTAIGLGAIWKFPYVTATNGGGAFLLVFLLFSFTLGVAVLVGETLDARQWLGIAVILLSLFMMKLPTRPLFKGGQAAKACPDQPGNG